MLAVCLHFKSAVCLHLNIDTITPSIANFLVFIVIKISFIGEDFDAEIDYNNVQDTKERSQTRQKKMEEKKMDQKSSALSELKAKRQEKERKDAERMKKEEQEEERKSRSKGRRSSSSESSSGSERSRRSSTSSRSSSGSGSDTERFKKSPSKVQKYIETQEDMEPVRLSRYKLEKFVHLPFFSKLVMNCFCRIGKSKKFAIFSRNFELLFFTEKKTREIRLFLSNHCIFTEFSPFSINSDF